MVSIDVKQIMDGRDFPTAGAYLYSMIIPHIDTEDKIYLDLQGVSVLPSMFLSMSFGKIIKERGVAFLKSKLVFTNIKASDITRIKEYVARFE